MAFVMHPLHTSKHHMELMHNMGVCGYHQFLEDKRFTGRTTAQALLADAIDNPGVPQNLVDHSGQRGGHEILLELVRKFIGYLDLQHMTFSRGTHPHGATQAVCFGEPRK